MADSPEQHRASLPPKKRGIEHEEPSVQQPQQPPPDRLLAADHEPSIDPLGLLLRDSEKQAKQARLEPSKIAGFAQPRKPRVGPQYQALVPDWPSTTTTAPPKPPPRQAPGS
jgi:hypothetical protein